VCRVAGTLFTDRDGRSVVVHSARRELKLMYVNPAG